ncbi:NPC intracellular cholesterol transporter 2 homolog a [Diachasma alloeum]|uniref:NPC intracellular cholesterol transporter 2 homolog a n=1 Tax=Diachasma alloeum TaxID=454923 RepID=UPI0007384205|nr:NPC intracellular cholesterol transporter 2 homolog a [Diachasma alloeum]
MCRTICALVVCLSALASAAEFKDCGSSVGKYSSISISDCGASDSECILTKGTNATIEISFSTVEPVNAVKAVVHGILTGVPIPFPISHPDACANPDTGITCPLKKDQAYTYRKTFPILAQYPKVKVEVKWELQNEKRQDIVCILIPAKIQEKKSAN